MSADLLAQVFATVYSNIWENRQANEKQKKREKNATSATYILFIRNSLHSYSSFYSSLLFYQKAKKTKDTYTTRKKKEMSERKRDSLSV